jgi:pimeloyl-ACP methyl ester carboxylesterase
MATFRSGGFALEFTDIRGGAAGTMVLTHGFASSVEEMWRRLGWLAAFERKGWRVVAFDQRGHGRSDKPHVAAAYARADMAGDILALMDHLNLPRADLMGYSMGAGIAVGAALAHPDRFGNLILGGIGARALQPAQPPGPMTMGEAMRAPDPTAIADPMLRSFRQFADEQGEDRLALAACSEGAGRPLTADDLARLSMPTLVVAGARDQLAGDPQGLADAIAGAHAVTLPACDHFSAIPHALCKAAVFDFLEGWLDAP